MGLFRLRQCCVKIGWEARLPASGGTGQLLSSGSFPVFTTDQRWGPGLSALSERWEAQCGPAGGAWQHRKGGGVYRGVKTRCGPSSGARRLPGPLGFLQRD